MAAHRVRASASLWFAALNWPTLDVALRAPSTTVARARLAVTARRRYRCSASAPHDEKPALRGDRRLGGRQPRLTDHARLRQRIVGSGPARRAATPSCSLRIDGNSSLKRNCS
jgi:hypothetical protein